MNFLPESGYGLSDSDYDDGFDFGDDSYEEFGIVTISEPTAVISEDSQPATNGNETVAVADSDTPSDTKPGGVFMVGGDSPEADRKETPKLETADKLSPSVATSSPAKQFSGKIKQGRFSPNLPKKPPSSKKSWNGQHELRSKFKRGYGSVSTRSCDPQEQSQVMEKGEELRVAISRGNVKRVKSILDSGFNVRACLNSGWPSLLHACESVNEEMVELLLERGADPNTHKDYYTALMAVCANKNVSKRTNLVSCARLLINKGAKVNSHDRHHMTPLLYASQNGHLSLVELLLSAGADVHKQESRNWTALSLAASGGHLQVVQLLVSHNANPEALTYMGDSPSVLALDSGHTEVADWLDSVTSSQQTTTLPVHPLLKASVSVSTRSSPQEPPSKETTHPARSQPTLPHPSPSQPAPSTPPTPSQPAPSTRPTPSQPTPSGSTSAAVSQDSCVQYGDLELFLLSQQLDGLLPLFRLHKVQFSDLIGMTDKELHTLGVFEGSTRRKLLAGIAELHQRPWDMPQSSNLPYSKTISCSEATVILSHLQRHTNYLKGTLRYLDNQLQANEEIIDIHTQAKEVDKFSKELTETVSAVTTYSEEVKSLENKIKKLLPEAAKPSSDAKTESHRGVTAVKVAATVAIATACAFCMYKLLVD